MFLRMSLVKTPPMNERRSEKARIVVKQSQKRTGGLDTEGQGADVDGDDTTGSFNTTENTTLDGGALGGSLVGVDTLGGLLSTKNSLRSCWTFGIRVEPPTRTI